jgi:PAS domain-containing protein
VNDALAGKTSVDDRNILMDGITIPMKTYVSPRLDDAGEVIGAMVVGTPIPEQREMLNKANERLEYLNKMPLLMAVVDPEGRIIFINDTALQGGERTLEELIGQCLWELEDLRDLPETSATIAGLIRNVVVTGQPGETEYDVKVFGGLIPVKSNALPILDEEGNVSSVLMASTPIPEQRRAINEANERLEYLNKMPQLLTVLDPEGRIEFVNDTGLQAGGQKLEDLVGTLVWNIRGFELKSETRDIVMGLLKDVVSKGHPVEGEYDVQIGTDTIPLKATALPLFDDEGNIRSVMLTNTPIFEQRRALNEAQERLEYLNKMPILLAVTDTEGRINFLNEIALRAGNLKMEDLVGTYIWDLGDLQSNPESQKIVSDLLKNAVATGQPGEGEYDVQTPHGILPLKVNALPILDDKGNVRSVLLANTPIPEQRRAINEARKQINIMNNLPLLFATVDRKGRVVFCNEAPLKAAGVAMDDVVGTIGWPLETTSFNIPTTTSFIS